LICDSDAPQVGSARSDWTGGVKVNRRKTKRRKTRPYCISLFVDRSVLPLQDNVKTSVWTTKISAYCPDPVFIISYGSQNLQLLLSQSY
jgi:hypothetical protein